MREGWSDAIGPVTHVSWRIHGVYTCHGVYTVNLFAKTCVSTVFHCVSTVFPLCFKHSVNTVKDSVSVFP